MFREGSSFQSGSLQPATPAPEAGASKGAPIQGDRPPETGRRSRLPTLRSKEREVERHGSPVSAQGAVWRLSGRLISQVTATQLRWRPVRIRPTGMGEPHRAFGHECRRSQRVGVNAAARSCSRHRIWSCRSECALLCEGAETSTASRLSGCEGIHRSLRDKGLHGHRTSPEVSTASLRRCFAQSLRHRTE
jgi:hypothetical protein